MAQSSTNSDQTLFFYDLETSGVNPRSARIMQFAGQRTDIDLNPIGDPFNILVKITEDVLPEPGAILVTGITPQKTLAEGISEAEFFKIFINQIATAGTIFVGFNNVRFDDEFIRFGLYRNFYEPYEWQWKDSRSRWDVLDLTRITRALRPDGIKWPFATDGKPTNRLEYLSSVNKLDHDNAHDALSDVNATIAVANLIKTKQPKLFDYLLSMRSKQKIEEFLNDNPTFVYVSGMYSADHEKLAVVKNLGSNPQTGGGYLVYNLLIDPTKFINKTPNELAQLMTYKPERPDDEKLPVKTLKPNKCPAISPLSTLKPDDKKRLKIDDDQLSKNLEVLNSAPKFYENLVEAIKIRDDKGETQEMHVDPTTVDAKLYDGFIIDADKQKLPKVHKAEPEKLVHPHFKDARLNMLFPLYKARNFPKLLTHEERSGWEQHKTSVYLRDLPVFVKNFESVANMPGLSSSNQYVLEELKMYVEGLIPAELYS